MAKKTILVLLVGLALTFVRLAEAQQQAKVPKIGLLGAAGPSSGLASLREVFPKALRELGYVEGKNIAIDNKLDRLPALADELVRLKVDVLSRTRHPLHSPPRTLLGQSPRFFWACLILRRQN
jgi:hypothetical protein